MANKDMELMNFLSEEEKIEYEKLEKKLEEQKKKLKVQRDKAVARQKAEQKFWKQVRDRKDEVMTFYNENGMNDSYENEIMQEEPRYADEVFEKVNRVCEMYDCNHEELFDYLMSEQQVNFYRRMHQ